MRVRAGNDAGDGPWGAEASETPVSGSSDADLSALTVDDGTGAASVDGFDPADTGYSLSVAGMVARVTVAATASHSKATVEIAPADADAGTDGHQVDLAGGPECGDDHGHRRGHHDEGLHGDGPPGGGAP